MPTSAIRKAAVLVTCLDDRSADELLDRLPTWQQQQVRDAVLTLGPVDFAEQRRVMAEFLHAGDGLWQTPVTDAVAPAAATPRAAGDMAASSDDPDETGSGVELAGVLSRMATAAPRPAAELDATTAAPRERFDFLHQSGTEELARLLEGEHPQTIAVVLSYQPTSRAAELLSRLGGDVQLDVVRRLAEWDGAADEVVADIEDSLRSRWEQQAASAPRTESGLETVSQILAASGPTVHRQLGAQLVQTDHALAARLEIPDAVAPANLEDVDPAALVAAIQSADFDLAVLALTGSSPGLVAGVLARLPTSEAKQLRRALDQPGPLQLSDIEQARQQLLRMSAM